MTYSRFETHINYGSHRDIENHLNRVNEEFTPILSSYINITDYSKKLFEKGIRYELWFNNDIKGLIAGYISDTIFFISNLSIESSVSGKGMMTNLLNFCFDDLSKKGILWVKLEVFKQNLKALHFYEKNGFEIIEEFELKRVYQRKLKIV